jgi:hypothetical protein
MGIPGDPGLGYLALIGDISGVPAPADPATAQRVLTGSQAAAWLYVARGGVGMNRRVRGVTMDMRGDLVSVAQWWTAP